MISKKVIIIGAGTAGLSARREVAKITDSYVVIDDGPLGTTCARVGCMPSKVLIEVANTFHKRKSFDKFGITGHQDLGVDRVVIMEHVRSLRDRFVRAVKNDMNSWTSTHLVRGRAEFVDKNQIKVGDKIYQGEKIILASGSSPIMPGPWREHQDYLFDTDAFFEMTELPKKLAIIGLGVIGLELGQALSRLGVEVIGINLGQNVAGLQSEAIAKYAWDYFSGEFAVDPTGVEGLEVKNDKLLIKTKNSTHTVDKAFLTMGRRPNLRGFGLENLGLEMDERGVPYFDEKTFQVGDSDIFIVGDVNAARPILHEASDEGRIAGYNAVRKESQCFQRRTILGVTFSDPNIAMVGMRPTEITQKNLNYVTGTVSYEGQGRAIVKDKEVGLLEVYVCRDTGKIIGAELMAPSGEHLAHLLAWGIQMNLTVYQMLTMPFYHPVIEEGLRTALRDAASKINPNDHKLELMRCEDVPVGA